LSDEGGTLGDRLRQVRGDLSQVAFAERLGVDKNSVGRYERDERQPDADYLRRIHLEFVVSVDWLLTGEGDMHPTEGTLAQQSQAVAAPGEIGLDEELMGRLVDGILKVYKEEGVRLPPIDLGRLVARFQADLVAAYDDPDERKVGLKLALQQLRRDLRAHPAADQSNSKRLA